MNPSAYANGGYPLLICGLPRAGTSFLFAVLSSHPAFANEEYKDKELRYFEKILGGRPWGKVDAVSQGRFAGIDQHIMPDILRTLDARLRRLRGGPQGHYINANPRDIFYSQPILEAVPDTRFLISLRDPLTNIWSALNYPTHTWGQRDETGFFREADVREAAAHWNKVAAHILRHNLHAQPETFFLLEQERLAEGSPVLHAEIESFLGLDGIAALLDQHANRVIHSSFIEANTSTGSTGHDRVFASREEKHVHFHNLQRLFAEDGRYAELVLDICGPFVVKLNDIGLLLDRPSTHLLNGYKPARGDDLEARPTLSAVLQQDLATYLLMQVAVHPAGLIIRVGACDQSALAPLRAERCPADNWRELAIEPSRFQSAESDALTTEGDILVIDAGPEGLDMLMGLDLVARRPRLLACATADITPAVLNRGSNVLTNLGYHCINLAENLLAVRRDCLAADALVELSEVTTGLCRPTQ